MAVRKGYKLTEVGELPEDWEVRELHEIATVSSGKRLPKGYYLQNNRTNFPYIRIVDLYNGGILLNNIKYVPSDISHLISAYRVYENDIIISVAGTLGLICKIPKILSGANLTENADRIYNIKCDIDFLKFILQSDYIKSIIESIKTTAAQPKLALERIRKFKITIPANKSEQAAIASAISDIDSLISSLEQLIAKKRLIKQGVMQELLTGKKRLPGFDDDWAEKRVCDMGMFIKGKGVTKEESKSGFIPCIRYGEIYTDHDDIIRNFYSFVSRDVANKAVLIKSGDILFTCSGETKEEIGKSVAFIDNIEAYAGGDIHILRTASENTKFLGYRLNAKDISVQKSNVGQGDSIVHISSIALGNIIVYLPKDLREQAAIASVLSDMDEEIAALDAKLKKLRQIKSGMMEELLTGRIRLV